MLKLVSCHRSITRERERVIKLVQYVFGYVTLQIKDIGYFISGLCGKSKEDFQDGNAKFITYKNIFNNVAINIEDFDMVKINDNEQQNSLEYGDIVFTGSSETPDECAMSSVFTSKTDEMFYLNSFCFALRPFSNRFLNPEYSKYLFRCNNVRKNLSRTANGVTRFNVSKKLLEKVYVDIPSLDVQNKIVLTLDNFYSLSNSISDGLPGEIEARKKQYEYYRDKLLTFKEKKSA